MAGSDNELKTLARQLGERLSASGRWVAVAESCTGGWIAKALTDIPGSSAWFERGFVTYSNAAKTDLLGMDAARLEQFGAVSEDTVRAMAAGALARSPADLVVAVTGIAGPGGGGADKPVGLVWFCWQRRGGEALVRAVEFAGDREAVRRAATQAALWGLIGLADG